MDGLDDFLDAGTTTAAPEPEAAPETVTPDRPRDEHGRFAPKAETGVEPEPTTEPEVPPTETKDQLPKEEYTALKAIRDENKGLKDTLASLQQQLQQLQAPKEPPAPPPTIWEDEQGWQQHLQSQVLRQADQLSRINASEMAARAQNPDFQEMYDLFNDLAAQNPSIVQQAMADPHPWGKAYQIAKNHARMQELSAVDVSDLEAKLREQIKAELAAQQPTTPTLPNSLADQQSARTGGAQPFTPPSLDDILRRT